MDTYVQKTDTLQITVGELTEKVNQLTTRVNQIRNELDTVIYPKLQNHENRITVLWRIQNWFIQKLEKY